MPRDKRIDDYISKAQSFAQPILEHLREVVHDACPDTEETIKWGVPTFQYYGEMMCGMAGFKKHVFIGFLKSSLMEDPKGILEGEGKGNLGKIKSLDELPNDRVIKAFIKQAMKLNEMGIKVSRTSAKVLKVPSDLAAALKKNKIAHENFEAFSLSARNEYIYWLEEAKTEATRTKRLATTIEWVAEGKQRQWKYQKKK